MSTKLINAKISFYKTIINELDLILSNEKINYLIGKNGSGKSNILKSIHLFTKPSNLEYIEPMIKRGKEKYNDLTTKINLRIDDDTDFSYRGEKISLFVSEKLIWQKINDLDLNNDFPLFSKGTYKKLTHPMFKRMTLDYLDINLEEIEDIIDDREEEEEQESIKEDIIEELGDSVYEKYNDYTKIHASVTELFKKKNRVIIEYINDSEDLIKHEYKYDLQKSSEITDNFMSREEMDFRLNDIINFLSSVVQRKDKDFNLKKKLRLYIEKNSIPAEEKESKIEIETDNLRDEIEKIVNESIDCFFEKYFSDEFDFKLNISLKGESIIFKIVPQSDYIFDLGDIEYSSDGAKTLINFIVILESITYSHKDKEIILLLDEPEKNLYPSLQEKFVTYLEDILKNKRTYILMTTHHMSMISENDVTINIVERTIDGETVINYIYGECDVHEKTCEKISSSRIAKVIEEVVNGNKTFSKLIKGQVE